MATSTTPTSAVPAVSPAPTTSATPALHLEKPTAIANGPSNSDLLAIIQQLQETVAKLSNPQAAAEQEPAAVEEKTYYHQTPGSNVVIVRKGPAGEQLPEVHHFDHRGEITTKDPVLRAFLDGIADKPGVPVYTKGAPHFDAVASKAAAEVIAAAERSIDKLGGEAKLNP